jgi:hypothetical protein
MSLANLSVEERADRIAEGIIKGRYGGLEPDDSSFNAEGAGYGGWGSMTPKAKKTVMIVLGGVLLVAAVGGIVGGVMWYKKKHPSTY